MAPEFEALEKFTPEQCAEIEALDPCNPFYTFAYAKAREATGAKAWLVRLRQANHARAGCLAMMKSGWLNRSLEIPSLPDIGPADQFWGGLVELCRRERVSELVAQSFASLSAAIPRMPGETGRRVREEHLVDLAAANCWSEMSSNHKRNIQKSKKAGILIDRTADVSACEQHARLQDASMGRRMGRGEQVQADAKVQAFKALVSHKAGELFRAIKDGEVVSSVLILRAKQGAYYHSAGTNSEGMAQGASHFLIFQVAEALRAEGLRTFNLGSAGSGNPGLERFKKGFGSHSVRLEAAEFHFGNVFQRSLGTMASAARRLLRAEPEQIERPAEREKGRPPAP